MPAAAYENSFICTKKTCFAGGTVPPCCRLWLLEIGLILVSVGNLLEDMFWWVSSEVVRTCSTSESDHTLARAAPVWTLGFLWVVAATRSREESGFLNWGVGLRLLWKSRRSVWNTCLLLTPSWGTWDIPQLNMQQLLEAEGDQIYVKRLQVLEPHWWGRAVGRVSFRVLPLNWCQSAAWSSSTAQQNNPAKHILINKYTYLLTFCFWETLSQQLRASFEGHWVQTEAGPGLQSNWWGLAD